MRSSTFIPIGLAVLAHTQSEERQDYAAICRADPPKTSKTFEDGYEIEYTCDSAGNSESLIGSGDA